MHKPSSHKLRNKRALPMTAEVKNVSEVVKESVAGLKRKAGEVSDFLRTRCAEADQALDMVNQLGDEIAKSTAELRGLLGGHTNSPPVTSDTDTPLVLPKKKDWFKA